MNVEHTTVYMRMAVFWDVITLKSWRCILSDAHLYSRHQGDESP